VAYLLHQFVDPAFRDSIPEDYPANLWQWAAMTLFSLGFTHLFMVFAPFDWSLRLTKSRWIAMLFSVIFGVFVVMAKMRSASTQIPASLFWVLLIARATTSTISVWFYSSYGAVLTCWWSFLLQIRHLFNVLHGS
jgi:hypothetical protein